MSFSHPQTRQGRIRITCVENASAPRDTVVIPFTLDRSAPKADADRLLEGFQFLWQCVPQVLAESTLHALHVEVQRGAPVLDDWEVLVTRGPLASTQLVHCVLRYCQRFADLATKQVPVVPTSHGWRNSTASVLDALAQLRGVTA